MAKSCSWRSARCPLALLALFMMGSKHPQSLPALPTSELGASAWETMDLLGCVPNQERYIQ